jgi:hypothetical protein
MLFAHFTTKSNAHNIEQNGITRFPFHLTTDLKRGSNYGSHAVVFDVEDEFDCKIGTVNTSKQVNGMIEYVIRDYSDLRSLLSNVKAQGVRHCALLNN